MVNSQYQVRPFVPGDRSSFEDLYRAVYGEAWREKTSLKWTLDYPLAEAGAAVAVEGDVVVSTQPYCDLPLYTPWGATRATLFLDVATHPAHQRRGLFRRVVAAASAAAFERGASIIMTTPNRLASRGFQTIPGWVRLCSLDCMLFPLGAGDPVMDGSLVSLGIRAALAIVSLLRKGQRTHLDLTRQSRYDIESPWSPSTDADELWSCAAPRAGIIVVRSCAFLRWRFGPDYRLFLARDSRAPVGYAAARVVTRSGLKIGMILDCVTTGEETNALPLLASAITWLREQGASAAMGYFLRRSALWHQACEAGFLRLPRSCAPRDYPVYVSVRPGDLHSTDLLNPSRWHISLADSDLV